MTYERKIIKDITKKNTVAIVVTNHVECYKHKMTLPTKRNNTIGRTNIKVLNFEHPCSHYAMIIIL